MSGIFDGAVALEAFGYLCGGWEIRDRKTYMLTRLDDMSQPE